MPMTTRPLPVGDGTARARTPVQVEAGRKEERCEDCQALPGHCECNTALNYESEEEEAFDD